MLARWLGPANVAAAVLLICLVPSLARFDAVSTTPTHRQAASVVMRMAQAHLCTPAGGGPALTHADRGTSSAHPRVVPALLSRHISGCHAHRRNVGIAGFEPTAPWTQTRCSTKLSYIPEVHPPPLRGGCIPRTPCLLIKGAGSSTPVAGVAAGVSLSTVEFSRFRPRTMIRDCAGAEGLEPPTGRFGDGCSSS